MAKKNLAETDLTQHQPTNNIEIQQKLFYSYFITDKNTLRYQCHNSVTTQTIVERKQYCRCIQFNLDIINELCTTTIRVIR